MFSFLEGEILNIVTIMSGRGTDPELVFETKLVPKHVKSVGAKSKANLAIRKHGRLVTLSLPSTVTGSAVRKVDITLTEAEVLMLAQLCRRGRSIDAFQRAMQAAYPLPMPLNEADGGTGEDA